MLSGVMLASRNAVVPQLLLSEPGVTKSLRVDLTAVRRFTRDDELTAFAEAYVNGSGSAADVEVTYAIASEAGVVYLTAPGRVVDLGAGDPRRGGYSGRLPLTALGPGNYVLTARATTPRGTEASRRFRSRSCRDWELEDRRQKTEDRSVGGRTTSRLAELKLRSAKDPPYFLLPASSARAAARMFRRP